jgi:antitoxin StbD
VAEVLLADRTVSATDLKRHGVAAFQTDDGSAVAVMANNRAAYYVLPAALYAELLETLEAAEDAELNRMAEVRRDQPRVRVSLADL